MPLIFLLYGLVTGSFLNVCIARIPEGESLIPGSRCPYCGRRLRWYELVPIVSWLVQGGKCRGCAQKISVMYPAVEGANALLWMAAALCMDGIIEALICAVLLSALLALGITDALRGEIPLGYNIIIAALGIAAMFLDARWIFHLSGALAVSLPLLLIHTVSRGRAIGGGDIKLMAAAGLYLGFSGIILAFVAACILGSIVHIARMLFFGAGRELRFGPYLAVAIAAAALLNPAFNGTILIGV